MDLMNHCPRHTANRCCCMFLLGSRTEPLSVVNRIGQGCGGVTFMYHCVEPPRTGCTARETLQPETYPQSDCARRRRRDSGDRAVVCRVCISCLPRLKRHKGSFAILYGKYVGHVRARGLECAICGARMYTLYVWISSLYRICRNTCRTGLTYTNK